MYRCPHRVQNLSIERKEFLRIWDLSIFRNLNLEARTEICFRNKIYKKKRETFVSWYAIRRHQNEYLCFLENLRTSYASTMEG